jgi:hypothetical protein
VNTGQVTVGVADTRLRWPADGIRSRLVSPWRRHPELVTAVLCAALLASGQRGPDLPAQAYRVSLFRQHGLVVFDSHWYAGHTVPGYSLIFPPLAALLGSRLVGMLACVAATAAFTRLLRGRSDHGHDIAVLWFAVISVVDLVVGRLPFALGLAFAIGALAATREDRRWWALALALAASAASPLAGAFLLLAAAAWASDAGWRSTWPLAGALGGIAFAAVFGEGGEFPFPAPTLLLVLGAGALALLLIPHDRVIVRRGVWLYAAASLTAFVVPNAVGGNMVRLGAVLAGPLAAYELVRAHRLRLLALLAVPLLAWQLAPVPSALATGRGNLSATPAYYAGLIAYLHAHDANGGRVEVPLTQGRWETDYLAQHVPLARGWERQVDVARNAVLYDEQLTPAGYYRWLRTNAVQWVALPDVPLDSSETGEAVLLRQRIPGYLEPAWADQHWQLWRVRNAIPLVSGPATLLSVGVARIRLHANAAGSAVVLVRWTRFWRVTRGVACVAPTGDGWTQVSFSRPGPVTITAKVGFGSLAGAGSRGSCRQAQR